MAYIEENMKLRRGQQQQESAGASAGPSGGDDPATLAGRLRAQKADEEGSVTNSMAMLTAIPEVDLGMEYVPCFCSAMHLTGCSARLRNIEDTEKAKAVLTHEKKERRKRATDEEHLASTRCTSWFT
jgi:hypothetical protein